MDAGVLLQVGLAGLSAGAVLGLVALGFTLVAGTVRVLHLAHGDVVVAAVLCGVLVVLGRTPVATQLDLPRSIVLLATTLVTGALLALLVALVAVRPGARPTGSAALGWVVGGVAAGLLIRAVVGLLLPQQGYAVPDPLRLASWTDDGLVHLPDGATLSARVPAVLVIGLLVAAVTGLYVRRSRLGSALRAVADDPQAATLCGVDVRRVVLLSFVIAGLLAGLAGTLDAPGRAVSADDGVVLGLSGIAAAYLGGLGRLRGAIVGGLVLGVLQSYAVWAVDASVHDLVPLGVLVVLLAARPRERAL